MPVATEAVKKVREKRVKAKNDPRLIAAARELKDRWLEHVNSGSGWRDVDRQHGEI
jgi:hypothetical protein